MRCDHAASALTDLADEVAVQPGAATRHIDRCLRCQAELAQHRKIRRSLSELRQQLLDPGPDLLIDVLAAVEAASGQHAVRSAAQRHRIAYVAAATAATAAGAAGAVLLASRSRRTRLAPTG